MPRIISTFDIGEKSRRRKRKEKKREKRSGLLSFDKEFLRNLGDPCARLVGHGHGSAKGSGGGIGIAKARSGVCRLGK